jgi:predicted anti-sigma-YlaC factor YlaD
MVTCRELIEFLDDYVADALPLARRAAFLEHLAICPPCRDYLKTYRDTIKLGRSVLADPAEWMSETIPEELVRAIVATRKRSV